MPKRAKPKKAPSKRPVGRPTAWDPAYCEKVTKFLRLEAGALDKDIAEFLGLSERTICAWKKKKPEFVRAIWEGKQGSDANVANSLYLRAIGYSHPDVHIGMHEGQVIITDLVKYYPPDTKAAHIWLTNRRGKAWKERAQVELSGPGGAPIPIENIGEAIDELALARRVAFALAAAKQTLQKAPKKPDK